MTEQPTPPYVYERVWKPVLEKDGEIQMQHLMEVLSDYASMLADTSMLYTYLTEGLIKNPQDPVEDVIEIADHLAAESIDIGIRDTLGLLLSLVEATESLPAEEQLSLLIKSINELYELGHEDVDA